MRVNTGKHYFELQEDLRNYFEMELRLSNWIIDEIEKQLAIYRPGAHVWAEDKELHMKPGVPFDYSRAVDPIQLAEKTGRLFLLFGWFQAQREIAEQRASFLRCVREGDSPQVEEFYKEFMQSGTDNETVHAAFVREIMWGTPKEEEPEPRKPHRKATPKGATHTPKSLGH